MEQFSQISTIKRQNLFNSQAQSKQYSQLKYSQASIVRYQNESLNIEKLLTSIGKRDEPSFELSTANYMPVTNVSNFQQRKFNGSGSKNLMSSFFTLNTTNPNLAIQSEPNSMLVGLSSYFDDEQLSYDSRVRILSENQQKAIRNILKFIYKAQSRNFKLKFVFGKMLKYAKEKSESYIKSLSVRQSDFIDLALKKQQDSYWHQKTHEKIGLPYYNKLVGLCAPELVANKKLQLIEKNVQKFKVLKESSIQSLQKSQAHQSKFRFNFKIVPVAPVLQESRVDENRNLTAKKKEERVIPKR